MWLSVTGKTYTQRQDLVNTHYDEVCSTLKPIEDMAKQLGGLNDTLHTPHA